MLTPPVIAAIEFANPAMLGWAAAATLPWLVNLWSRRRHVEMPWAAIDLLITAVRERSRRLKLRELLLLVLRTAVLLLVALAAGQPSWRPNASWGARAAALRRFHHVLVIDRSMSMAAQRDDGTRLETAKHRAAELIEAAPTGDAFSVIAWAHDAENLLGRPTFEPQAALAAVDGIQSSDAAGRLAIALGSVEHAVSSARESFPDLASRVVFLTDLTLNTWSEAIDGAAGAELPQRWQALADRAEVLLINADDAHRGNAAITSIRCDPAMPVVGKPVNLFVQYEAFGRIAQRAATLELFVDGRRQESRRVELLSAGKGTTSFAAEFSQPGGHLVEARLSLGNDPLDADNRRWLALAAGSGEKAACFADDRAEAVDVARALNPRFETPGAEGRIEVDLFESGRLTETQLGEYTAILLCNVAELTPREQRSLRAYVSRGGGLIVVLGDRVDAAAYSAFFVGKALRRDAADATSSVMLPVELAETPAAGEWRLDPLGYRHPVAAPFAWRPRAGLLSVRASRYVPLKPVAAVAADGEPPETALAFSSGDPALLVGDFGDGRIAVLATNPALANREPWTTLAVSPSFVPLIRELLGYVATQPQVDRLNRVVGEPLPDDSAGTWKPREGNAIAPRHDVARAGAYRLGRAAASEALPRWVAVNIDPDESDLAALQASDLLGPAKMAVSGSHVAASQAGDVRLAGYLLAAAAALLLIELTAAWLLGRGIV